MVFWLEFSVSSANSRVRDQELFIAFILLWGLLSKESGPCYQVWNHTHSTWERAGITLDSPRGQTLSLCRRNTHLSVTDSKCTKEIWIIHFLLACWGALITPMSYPNWKEPSTAVRTVKAKVQVTCGEWSRGLGNARRFQYPSSCQSAAWTSDRLQGCFLPLILMCSGPCALSGGQPRGLWEPFIISSTLLKLKTFGTAVCSQGTKHPFPHTYLRIKIRTQD